MRLNSVILTIAVMAATSASGQAPPIAAPAPLATAASVADLAPRAPDYDRATSWAAVPGGPGASATLPAGASPANAHPAVDVFYVHPTTFRSTTAWNQDINDAAASRWVDESVVARQAGAFNGCCRIFAPRYRAASTKVFTNAAGRDAAFALAYGDVERAFDWYLAHENHGRPFILAGHSQGAFHIAMLLERRIDGTALQRQLVAAYVVGNNLAEGEFGLRFHHVGICKTPAQTGCVVQWNSVLPTVNLTQAARAAQQTFVDKYGDVPGKLTLCVNPLTFDRQRPSAPTSAAKGAVTGSPGYGAMLPLRRGAVAARCDQGMLVVEPDAALALDPLPGGSMHYHDIGLFYADVRANAMLRAKAWGKHR